ncbi:hypothetical protein [Embleya scabrispora]|uniref:hypothetical protein n=1 Tax=Embleya scabrispora TaxID=159449 RepID=UPI00035D41EC|nr:hypothetical protein [Embleya scabrispora]MYS87616.1 hypothetical protein [Streptomyces sp. SID5474]
MIEFALDYSTLSEAKKDMHDLADRISPTLKSSDFATLGQGGYTDAQAVFGDQTLTGAFRSLYRLSAGPMTRAEDLLKKLGDCFGTVGDAYFNADAQITEGLGVMGATMGLEEWRNKVAAWKYKQDHIDECGKPGPDGSLPEFCKAQDPGDKPPLDQVITTPNGGRIETHLTLDEHGNVIKEETKVVSNGQTYTSVTTYDSSRLNYTTVSTAADGGVTTTETHLNADGGGTQKVVDSEGKTHTYTRTDGKHEWVDTTPKPPEKPVPPGGGGGGGGGRVPRRD